MKRLEAKAMLPGLRDWAERQAADQALARPPDPTDTRRYLPASAALIARLAAVVPPGRVSEATLASWSELLAEMAVGLEAGGISRGTVERILEAGLRRSVEQSGWTDWPTIRASVLLSARRFREARRDARERAERAQLEAGRAAGVEQARRARAAWEAAQRLGSQGSLIDYAHAMEKTEEVDGELDLQRR